VSVSQKHLFEEFEVIWEELLRDRETWSGFVEGSKARASVASIEISFALDVEYSLDIPEVELEVNEPFIWFISFTLAVGYGSGDRGRTGFSFDVLAIGYGSGDRGVTGSSFDMLAIGYGSGDKGVTGYSSEISVSLVFGKIDLIEEGDSVSLVVEVEEIGSLIGCVTVKLGELDTWLGAGVGIGVSVFWFVDVVGSFCELDLDESVSGCLAEVDESSWSWRTVDLLFSCELDFLE